MAEIASIVWGAYLAMGIVFGLITGFFVPGAWAFILSIWGISGALFIGLVGLKALGIRILPKQHKRNRETLERLVAP